MNKLGFRTVVTALLIILSGYFLFPTFEWYRMSDDEKAKAEKKGNNNAQNKNLYFFMKTPLNQKIKRKSTR